MPLIRVITRAGAEMPIEGDVGISVMETIRTAGIYDLQSLCGGECLCATCHVYVHPTFAGRVSAISDHENNMLDGSIHRTGESRLSCQISLSESLDGLTVTIAPEG